MITEQQTLVQCGAISYVYNYRSANTISKFLFEDEGIQLTRLIATNFMDDFVNLSFKINIFPDDLEGLQQRLDTFLEHFAKRGLKYIAILDLARQKPAIHLLTNKSPKLSDDQLSEVWGNKVCSRYVDYNELQEVFPNFANKSSSLTTEYVFMSANLKKPRILHNDAALDYLYAHDIFDDFEYEEYKLHDERCGTVVVHKYINLP